MNALLLAPLLLPLLALLLWLWRGPLWRPRPLPGVRRPRPWLLGHRGVRGERFPDHPENTLAAFERALGAGLDGLEVDVQRSRDGALVLFHDFHLQGRELRRLDLADIERLDPRVPRLEALFDLAAAHPGTLLNLELKEAGWNRGTLARALARAVRRAGLQDRVLVSSFNPLTLAWLRLAAPELRCGLLFAPGGPAWLASGRLAGWLHVDALHPHHSLLDAPMARRARRRGLLLNAWTVNDPQEVARLLRLGVDGLIADDPEALRRAAGRDPAGNPAGSPAGNRAGPPASGTS